MLATAEHEGHLAKVLSRRIFRVHRQLHDVNLLCGCGGCSGVRSRSNPSTNANEDDSSGGGGEQIGLIHHLGFFLSENFSQRRHGTCRPYRADVAFHLSWYRLYLGYYAAAPPPW
jgi:hypothetical protein